MVIFLKMVTPRDIFELADSVELVEGLELDECVHRSPWAQTFLKAPKMLDPIGGPDRRELFFYVICCSALSRTPTSEKEKTRKLLTLMKERFFADSEFWQASVAFMDIHNVQDDIFRYSLNSLIVLKQSDENVFQDILCPRV